MWFKTCDDEYVVYDMHAIYDEYVDKNAVMKCDVV